MRTKCMNTVGLRVCIRVDERTDAKGLQKQRIGWTFIIVSETCDIRREIRAQLLSAEATIRTQHLIIRTFRIAFRIRTRYGKSFRKHSVYNAYAYPNIEIYYYKYARADDAYSCIHLL